MPRKQLDTPEYFHFHPQPPDKPAALLRNPAERFRPDPRRVPTGYFTDQGDGTLLYAHRHYRSLHAVTAPPITVQGIWNTEIAAESGYDIVQMAAQNARFNNQGLSPHNFGIALNVIMPERIRLEFMSGRSDPQGETELLLGYQHIRHIGAGNHGKNF
jgi:hypothetical protein